MEFLENALFLVGEIRRIIGEACLFNSRLVASIASKCAYVNKEFDRYLCDDLIQEGQIGIRSAIYYFNDSNDNAFGTYASWWIHQRIRRKLVDNRTIRIPVHAMEQVTIMKRMECELEVELKRAPNS